MKRTTALTVALLLIAMAATTSAAQLPPLKFVKDTLSNGLQVIYVEDHDLPRVTVYTSFHVGSKNEKVGHTGLAHLFEHLMSYGSEHVSDSSGNWLMTVGGTTHFRTSEDMTVYMESGPSNYLEHILWIGSDRIGFMLPAITQEKLDAQRNMVTNERHQIMDNEPYAKSEELLLAAIYPPEHPYHWPTIGSPDDISHTTLDDVRNFFRTYYVPNNATLTIVGDFNPAQTCQWVEKYYGTLPPGPPIDRLRSWTPVIDGVKRVSAQDHVRLSRLYMAWVTPPQFAPDCPELMLLQSILTQGRSARLYRSLAVDQKIAQSAESNDMNCELNSTFGIVVTDNPEHSLAEIEAATDKVIQDIQQHGVTPEEVRYAQNYWQTAFLRRMQSPIVLANRIALYNTMLESPDRFQWIIDQLMKVTPADIQRVARKYLDFDHRVILSITPQGNLEAARIEVDRTITPADGPEPIFTPPEVEEATLSNGLKLLLVEKHNLPLIEADVVVKSGFGSDPVNKSGTANLTVNLLAGGTTTRSSTEISNAMQDLGGRLQADGDCDGSRVCLNIPKENLEPALAVMSDVLLHPAFTPTAFEKTRSYLINQVNRDSEDPLNLSFKVFYRSLYGLQHPYGQTGNGTLSDSTLRAVTRDDVLEFYRRHYLPNNAAVIIVGDLTMSEAKAAMENAFAQWKPGNFTPDAEPTIAPPQTTAIYLVHKKDAPQSAVVIGQLGIRRSDPDYYAAALLNEVIGNSEDSRLHKSPLVKNGYTYTVGSEFAQTRFPGSYVVYSPMQTDHTAEAIAGIVQILRDLSGPRPVTAQELKNAKLGLCHSLSSEFSNFTIIAENLTALYERDVPGDFWKTYADHLNAVTTEEAARVARDRLHSNALVITVVGDLDRIEPEIRRLKLGDITVLRADE